MSDYLEQVLDQVVRRNPAEPEFHQAAREVIESLGPALDRNPQYRENRLLERFVEPERVVMFRVPWLDDENNVHPCNHQSALEGMQIMMGICRSVVERGQVRLPLTPGGDDVAALQACLPDKPVVLSFEENRKEYPDAAV